MKITNRRAIEAQMALTSLIATGLPIRASFDIALLSSEIDKQVQAFSKVRDALIKNYQIKVSAGEKDNSVVFTTNISGEGDQKEKALVEFTDKINELMETEGGDISIKITLPADLNVRADVLKPVLVFITVEGINA